MCRWLAYSGAPIYLEELIFKPEHSLIDQSLSARVTETTTNGDGFGLGWFGSRWFPGVYRDVRPAWNDQNLQYLAAQIQSPLFVAHVRSATTGPVQQTNCHPFRFSRWLFMHNGSIRGFGDLRRELMMAIAPDLFSAIEGTTDSELMFYLALTFGLDQDPLTGIARMVGFIEGKASEQGIGNSVYMTLGLTDGRRLFAFRYATAEQPPSLFYSTSMDALDELHRSEGGFSPDARAVVSEPLSNLTDHWQEIPPSTVVVVERGDVTSRPFQPLPAGP
jgi:glutamine amidotransferase